MTRHLLNLFLILLLAGSAYGQSQFTWSTKATGTNTYTAGITGFPGWGSTEKGVVIDVKFLNPNTTSSTLEIETAGPVALKKLSSGSLVDLVSGDIVAGYTYRCSYNGTVLIVGLPGAGGGGAVATVTGDGVDNTDPLNPVLTFPTKAEVGLGSVENTALSTWPGTANINTLGTIGTGTWNGSVVGSLYGGTGINNGGRTLTVSTNSGTLIFTNSSTPLTIANTASISGTNTGDQTSVTGNAGTATSLQNARTFSLTGDATGTSAGFDGTANASIAATLATVNANTGTYGSATAIPQITYDAKGRAIAVTTVAPQTASGSQPGFIAAADWLAHSRKAAQRVNYINAQTGTSYTLAASDTITTTIVTMSNASANTLFLPKNATVPFVVNQLFWVEQVGDGITTISPEDGTVSVTYEAGVGVTNAVYKGGPNLIRKTGTNSYHVYNGTPPITPAALTKTNGAYITITVGGTPATALLQAVNITADLTGTVPVILGGTGLISYNTGDILWASAGNTLAAKNVFNTTPTAYFHVKAGTATAGTAPIKLTSGPLNTTAEAGAYEYNGSHYNTKASGLRFAIGGPIAVFTTDVSNSGTSETDIYSYTTPASSLAATGEMFTATFSGTLTDNTSTATIKVYWGGGAISNTGAITVSAVDEWTARVTIIRTGTTTARASVVVTTLGATYNDETDITSLVFTNSSILKITGTAGGAGGGTGDITGKLGTISWYGAPQN